MTPTDAQGKATSEAQRTVLTLWLTIALSAATLGLFSAIVWHLTPPLVIDAGFLEQFTLYAGYFFADQPKKSTTFELGCVAAPFVIALGHFIARALTEKISVLFLPMILRLAVGATWLFFLWCISPLAYCPHPVLEGMPPSWLLSKWFFVGHPQTTVLTRVLYLALIGGFGIFLALRRGPRRQRQRALGVLLTTLLALAPLDFYTADQVNNDDRFTYHFNVLTHALSQVIGGHHLLVHYPHIYGGYAEFLGPLLACFPRQIETLLFPLPLLQVFSLLGFLLTARLVIRSPILFFIAGLAFLGSGYLGTSGDHYYQYEPIRTVFPAWGLLAVTLFFRRPAPWKYVLVSGLAGLAPLWNFDTGIVLWLSWTATLMARPLGERRPFQAFRQFGLQVASLIACGGLFLLYLGMVSGSWPDPRQFFTFQKLVVGSGYMCLDILVPDFWLLVLVIYLVGLSVAYHAYEKRISSWHTDFILMTSLLGLGLFLYFFGRSAESNLVGVAYPVILVMGVLLDKTRLLIRLGQLPRITYAFLFPFGAMIAWEVAVFALALPDLLDQSAHVASTWSERTGTPFEINVAFVKKEIRPGEDVFMLSNQSGFYHYLSGTVCPIDLPGPGELLLSPSMETLIASLNTAQFPKLVVDENFYGSTYRGDLYDQVRTAVAAHYRPVATSATGQVTLYVPR